jgi:hypothetical protein
MSRRWRRAPTTAVVATLIGIAIIAAACGGGAASPGVAGIGSSTTTTTASSVGQTANPTNYEKALSYVKCMRNHGITDMPDPDSVGNIDIKALHPGPTSDLNPANAEFVAANKACQHLLPNGGQVTPAEQQHNQAQALAWAHCMRAHGISNFPDPGSNGRISVGSLSSAGVKLTSPQGQAALTACRQFQPNTIHVPGGT